MEVLRKMAQSQNGNGLDHDEDVPQRKSIVQSIDALTLAIQTLTVKLDTFMALQQKSIPYPLVIIMFLILIGVLFGAGAMQKAGILPVPGNL